MKGLYTYRLKYAKTDKVRYISHLDFVRVLNRAVRRSELPVTHTEGFNPHPVMTVALPLSVGVTSECEYIDIGFDEQVLVCDAISRFNEAFENGIEVLDAKILGVDDIPFRDIDTASYRVEIEMESETLPDIDAFMARKDILMDKRSKSGVKEVDIKADIWSLKVSHHNGMFCTLEMTTSAGNTFNLKPELVVAALAKYLPNWECVFMQVHRTGLYAKGKML